MRILSIGRPLAHPNIDNHTIFNAPSVGDYDAVVLDPGGILEAVREAVDGSVAHRTYSDLPVSNGLTTPDTMSIAEVMRRRLDEVSAALQRGGVVIVFLYPQALLPDVVGFSGADRYWYLPAPAGLSWGPPLIRWSEGSAVATTDHGHPLAPVLDVLRNQLLYRGAFDEAAPGFAGAARVFARSGGGMPAGVEFSVMGGTVVFVPTPRNRGGESALALGSAIEAAARDLLGRADPGESLPYWADNETVPGLAALEDEVTKTSERAHIATEQANAAEQEAQGVRTLRDVLWREGRYSLLPAAMRCFELLGFRIWPSDEPTLRCAEGDLLVEVEGSNGTVGMGPHYRLRARLDAELAEGRVARGLVLVNGERMTAPQYRLAPYIDALRVAAEASRYALLTAPQLFEAAMLARDGADDEALSAIRRRLLETDGVVNFNTAD